jgi:hypothetical protein
MSQGGKEHPIYNKSKMKKELKEGRLSGLVTS